MALWGGRFTQAADQRFKQFNDSLRFDYRLAEQDIVGSVAWMTSIYTAIMQSGQSLHTAATAGFIVGACIVGCGVLASALIIPTRKINS